MKVETNLFGPDTVMPCFVFFKDRHGNERIGIAEKRIDDEWFAVWFNSTMRDVCLYKDAVLFHYQQVIRSTP